MTKPFFTVFCLLTALLLFGAGSCFADTPLRAWPTLSKEVSGDAPQVVRPLQLLLAAHGGKLSADGVFGDATQKALRRFQGAHRLVTTGETNNPTWEALIVPVQAGSTGPAVRAAQFALRSAGYAVAVDGVFGTQMTAAVKTFQKRTGHTADGVVGRRTWYELLGGGDNSPGY